MPLTDVITRFSTAVADGTPLGYPVTRTAAGTYNSQGVLVPGATSTFTIDACVVPLALPPGRERMTLPEGVHLHDIRVIDTITPLRAEPPDIITIAGEPYAVFKIEAPVNYFGGARYTAYASRQVIP
jgi:hypothetical protein